jgi:NAD(P)-dependent dehydrogenase (short-subunit alcohol dehydrogenase family)
MAKTIIISGASSGFGAMTARALADAGDTVYAGMRATTGRNAPAVADLNAYAADHSVTLRAVEMDVASQASVDAAIKQIIADTGRLDVVVHNAGHMVLGPAEAFTVEQVADIYDVNVLSTQRVNRAALPHLRAQRDGLLVWVGSSSSRGGTPPYLAPYFAAKAAEDALAVSYAAELARFGIDTTIIVPGAFTTGTNHYAHAGHPARHCGRARLRPALPGHHGRDPGPAGRIGPARRRPVRGRPPDRPRGRAGQGPAAVPGPRRPHARRRGGGLRPR